MELPITQPPAVNTDTPHIVPILGHFLFFAPELQFLPFVPESEIINLVSVLSGFFPVSLT